MRGFEDSTLGPRGTPRNNYESLPFGGNALIQGGVELLFPLPFVKDQRSLRTTLFFDVGNVFDTNCGAAQRGRNDPGCDIDLGNMASSVGVGLTWITALGPLSFSLARPINEPENADTQFFQFSLGQTY